jgi:hypothetical protein
MASSAIAWGGTEKLSPELMPEKTANKRASDGVEVIVQYKATPTEAHHQKVAALGGKLNHRMDFIKGAHYTVPVSALSSLASDPDVAYVTPNRPLKSMFDNITAGTVNSVTDGYSLGMTGVGIGIALIDSGVTELGDFEDGALWRQVSNAWSISSLSTAAPNSGAESGEI